MQEQERVYTGVVVAGMMKQNWAGMPQEGGTWGVPEGDGYEVARIYKEARERLLEELRLQVEVNRRLSRELTDLRLELAQLKHQGQ